MPPGKAKVSAEFNLNEAQLRSQTLPTFRRAVREIAVEIEREAKRIVPVRTGYTRSTIRAQNPRVTGMALRANVTAGGAAVFLQKGTRPHLIVPRRAKVLHFYWDKVGREVFLPRVNHPGTRANPFLTIAAERVAARHR
jgi:hypothetical protein